MSNEKLGDITGVITSGSRGWASYYSDDGALFLRMTNLPKSGIKLLLDDNKFVKLPEKFNEGKRTAVQNGDILISITAELGKIGFVENIPHDEAYVNQHVCLVRPIHKKVNSKFLAYYLSFQPQRNLLNRLNDSGAKSGLNLSTVSNFPVRLPDPKTQEFVVEALEQWDTAIEKTEALIDAKERQFGWLKSKLLKSVSENHADSKKRLPEVCKIRTGKKDVNQGNPDGRYPFFTCAKEHTYSDSYSYDMEAILLAGNGYIGNPVLYRGKFEAYQRTYILHEFLDTEAKYLNYFLRRSL